MKRLTALLIAMMLCTIGYAGDSGKIPLGNSPAPVPGTGLGLPPQVIAACPPPYTKYTQGVDPSKGEYYCVKSHGSCPQGYGFSGTSDDATGRLTCVTNQAPVGWTSDPSGKLVFNSIPQPMVPCPSSTPDWKWGTTYWKESWNRMGCRANLKPAY